MTEAKRLPYHVKQAFINVCGRAFWLKQPLFDMFLDAGISEEIIHLYENESKYKIARGVLAELEKRGEEGYLIQKRLLTKLCNLRNLVDDTIPDRNAGLDALRELKKAALEADLIARKAEADTKAQQEEYRKRVAETSARTKKLEDLNNTFKELLVSPNPHERGYSLEDLLVELFATNDVEYHKAYKTATGQIDGHFRFEGFDYLVEARWRKEQPSVAEIGGFKTKVDKVIQSTRGLFIAVQGIRPEVIQDFSREGAKLIFMDGGDLICILEGRSSLRDALKIKIDKAAQEGIVFWPLYK